jgi:hypothetical protein
MEESLLGLLDSLAQAQRIDAVEQAEMGRGFGQYNFKARWQGYSLNNKPTVEVNGREYNTEVTVPISAAQGSQVYLRAGKDIKFTSW